jgi:hypothetical protein
MVRQQFLSKVAPFRIQICTLVSASGFPHYYWQLLYAYASAYRIQSGELSQCMSIHVAWPCWEGNEVLSRFRVRNTPDIFELPVVTPYTAPELAFIRDRQETVPDSILSSFNRSWWDIMVMM